MTGRGLVAAPIGDDVGGTVGAATAVDPVCKMTVDPATAISAEVDGQMYYFCAQGCRKAFLNDPTGRVPDPV